MSIEEISSRRSEKVNNARGFLDNRANVFVSPKSAKGLSGWEFDVPQSETLSASVDVTDHYVESGTFLNDHMVVKPIQITLSGLKGEVVFRPPEGILGQVQELNNRLEVVEAYLPGYTFGMLQEIQRGISRASAVVSRINQNLDRTQNILDALGGEGPERTEQEKAYTELRALMYSTQLVTVQTPWRYFEDMKIINLNLSQGEDSSDYSRISITLKEMRFANIEVNTFDEVISPPREEIQKSEEQDTGIIKGTQKSFLKSLRDELRKQ